MHARKAFPAILGVAALLAPPALFAAPLHITTPLYAAFGKAKTVKFDIRNNSVTPVELRAGDKVQTVEAGKTITLNLPVGTRVVANKAAGSYAEGAVIAEVQPPLSGNTVVLH